jgi:hypothetical protein
MCCKALGLKAGDGFVELVGCLVVSVKGRAAIANLLILLLNYYFATHRWLNPPAAE